MGIKAAPRSSRLPGHWIDLAQSCSETEAGLECESTGTLRVESLGNRKVGYGAPVLFHLSEGQVLDAGHLLLQEIGLGAMRRGDFKTKRLNASLKPGHSATDRYAIAWIDASDLVMEWDETDNLVLSQRLV